MSEADEGMLRHIVVTEARSWIGTRYVHRGRMKGPQGGVDCAQLVYLTFFNCNLSPEMPLTAYTPDFFCHRGVEQYMDTVLAHCRVVENPKSGDIALFKIGRIFAHGGIVTEWPTIIHADRVAKIVLEENINSGRLAGKPVKFFTRW